MTDHASDVRRSLLNPRELCDRLGISKGCKPNGNGITIRCPFHEEHTPSCSVKLGQDGTIFARCFSCGATGDALTLIANVYNLNLTSEFKEVLAIGAELAGDIVLAEEIRDGHPNPKVTRRKIPIPEREADRVYPPANEVEDFWNSCRPIEEDETCREYLRGRAIDPEKLESLARFFVVVEMPEWAKFRNTKGEVTGNWYDRGFRIVLPVFDLSGKMRSVRGWQCLGNPGPKRLPPRGFKAAGLLLANGKGQAMLAGEGGCSSLVIVEGEPDFLTWVTRVDDTVAVLGVLSGAWSKEVVQRIPWGIDVYVRTHCDSDKQPDKRTGEKYAQQIIKDIGKQCKVWRLGGASADENDRAQRDDLPFNPAEGCACVSGNARAEVRASLDPERPTIHLTTALHESVDECEQVLVLDRDIYQRDGELVTIVRVSKDEANASLLEGTPTIRKVTNASLRERLQRFANVMRWDDKIEDFKPARMPKDICEMLSDRGMWRTVRPITGIVEAPMFLGDGSIMQQPGYDRRTGYVYAPSCDFPQVPEQPTEAQVTEAALLLREPWNEFAWRDKADLAVMVALLLSILCRPAIGDVPAFALDATTPGSGKGLALDVASVIATGRKANKQTYAYDPIEQEKILGAMAMRGAALIAFDDIKEPFGGSPLCKVLTCGGANSFRVLGRSEAPDLPWHAIVTVTGNNITLMGDIPRRVVMARLEPEIERPELRTDFSHPRLLDWVVYNRPRLVVAALTIARGWWLAGKPHMGLGTLGSFEAWAELVPRVCVFAGLANPMDCCPSNQNIEDPEQLAMRTVLHDWPILAPIGDTVGNIVGRLWPEEMKGKIPIDAWDDLRAALHVLGPTKRDTGIPDTKRIGKVFSTFRGRIIGGRKLGPVSGAGGIAVWRVLDTKTGLLAKQSVSIKDDVISNSSVGSVGSVGSTALNSARYLSEVKKSDNGNNGRGSPPTGRDPNQPTQYTQPTQATLEYNNSEPSPTPCPRCGQWDSFCLC